MKDLNDKVISAQKAHLSPNGKHLYITFRHNDGKWYSCFLCWPGIEGSSSGHACENEEEAIKQGAQGCDTFPFPQILITMSESEDGMVQ